jgi:2-hydroxychromene-2-carboxylate isomerase
MTMRRMQWVFDVISPFAFLSSRQLAKVPEDVQLERVPILFGGLLTHYGSLGNAEIASKRRFTYRFALWRAQQMGIEMQFPPTHPFNPLAALRLIIAAGSDRRAVDLVFDAVFLHGRDVADMNVIADLAATLGIPDAKAAVSDPKVKQQLHDNTAWAISRGVFGVPTFIIDDELFWGHDAFEMALDFLREPGMFQDAKMKAVDSLPVGIARNRK